MATTTPYPGRGFGSNRAAASGAGASSSFGGATHQQREAQRIERERAERAERERLADAGRAEIADLSDEQREEINEAVSSSTSSFAQREATPKLDQRAS